MPILGDEFSEEEISALIDMLTNIDKAIIKDRYLQAELKGARFTVFAFIFDRTVWWKKDWELITSKQIRLGVRTADGRLIHRGTGLARSTIDNALRQVYELGYIDRQKTHYEYGPYDQSAEVYYKYRIAWENIVPNMDDIPIGLSIQSENTTDASESL